MLTMKYRRLGNTPVQVSEICLGTMTWGQQNTNEEGHSQLDFALEKGINFIDTAEMYPVPPMEETCHRTEEIIGNWLKNRQDREKLIIATKVSGRTSKVASGPPGLDWIRGGPLLNKKHIDEAVNGSLKRLKTDYIDLYQIHWPERIVNNFGSLSYKHMPREDDTSILETLEALSKNVELGKIKYLGLSNETPWGVMQFINLSETLGFPRVVSIQNPYNLLNRSFEVGLSEISVREKVGLLAYSPLAFGVLSGKYLNDGRPEKARISLFPRFKRYLGVNSEKAVEEYISLSARYNIDPCHLALSYVTSRDFVTSNIIGATTLQQLEVNINSISCMLSEEIIKEIEKIHNKYTFPCP